MDKYILKYENCEIEINICRKNIKKVYIQYKNNEFFLKIPLKYKSKNIDIIINEFKNWILKKYLENKFKQINKKENIINLFGEEYLIVKIKNQIKNIIVDKENKKILIDNDIIENESNINNYIYLNLAKKYLPEIFDEVMDFTKLKPEKFIIKNLKSSWGNCKSNKIITINANLIMFDMKVIKYVIIHELCHLKQMNHSDKFWSLVEKYEKNYKEIRKSMKYK